MWQQHSFADFYMSRIFSHTYVLYTNSTWLEIGNPQACLGQGSHTYVHVGGDLFLVVGRRWLILGHPIQNVTHTHTHTYTHTRTLVLSGFHARGGNRKTGISRPKLQFHPTPIHFERSTISQQPLSCCCFFPPEPKILRETMLPWQRLSKSQLVQYNVFCLFIVVLPQGYLA